MVRLGECSYCQHDLIQALSLANQARRMAMEAGLGLERGLACMLEGKILVSQTEYGASFDMFAEALTSFADNDVLEQVRVRLWWGYSLLLDLRVSAAFEQLQEVLRVSPLLGELLPGLASTVAETRQLLLYFRHWADTPPAMRDDINLLLKQQGRQRIEVSKSGLQVFAFGPASVIAGGKYKYFFNARGKIHGIPEFLLYLILEGGSKGMTWDKISVGLWPGRELNDRSRDKFHKSLRKLKNMLGPDHVTQDGRFYRVDYLEWCDAIAFDALLKRIDAVACPGEALTLQLEAISLYQGEFLAGFELTEWGVICRTRYEARVLQTIRLAGEGLLEADEPRQALQIIDKGLVWDYYREDLHRVALKAYARLGLRGDLKKHYHTVEQELGGLESRTQELFNRLIAE